MDTGFGLSLKAVAWEKGGDCCCFCCCCLLRASLPEGCEVTRKGSESEVGVVGPSACEVFNWACGNWICDGFGEGWRCEVLSESLLLLGEKC